MWILWTALSGANLVHDVGYIESGLTCSYEMMVINDETISFVRRLLAGIKLSPETLALHVIDAVGPGGNYLAHKHTRDHFRDMWMPQVFDRRMHGTWIDSGEPTAIRTAQEFARETIATHQPEPLTAEAQVILEAIIAEADDRAGVA